MGKNLMTDEYNATLIDIKNIIFQSRDKAYKVISYATLDTYWKIGKRIFKEEQNGKERAAYGENLIKILSAELTKEYGKGFSERNLRNFRKFYILFPDKAIWQTCLPNLNWSHICSLLRVSDEAARLWYMKEAASEDIARYSVLHDNDRLFMSKYLTYLPTKEQLRTEIERQKDIFYMQHPQEKEDGGETQ